MNSTSVLPDQKSHKKNCVIVFFITKDYAFTVANMIIGLNRYSPNLADDIIIFHEGLSDDDKNCLNILSNKIIFKKFTKDEFMNKISTKLKNNKKFIHSIEKYTYLNLAKFEIFNLLNNYKNVIMLDTDMLIQKDFSEILNYKPAAWRPTVIGLHASFNYNAYDFLTKDSARPNGGLLYICDELDSNFFSTEQSYIFLDKYIDDIKGTLDETTFALMFHKNNIKPKTLPVEYNSWVHYKNSFNSYIIHAMGKNKFWNNQIIKMAYPEWEFNNKIWKSIGGKSYTGNVQHYNSKYETPSNFINTSYNEILWDDIILSIHDDLPYCIYCSQDKINNYYQLFILLISKDIHYELVKQDENEIKICLHCEDKELCKSNEFKNLFININKGIKDKEFNLDIYEHKISINKIVKKDDLVNTLLDFIHNTYSYLYTFFKINIENKQKVSNSMNNTALHTPESKGLKNSVVTSPTRVDLGGNLLFGDPKSYSPLVVEYVIKRFSIRSVLDMGSGRGYLSQYIFNHYNIPIISCEGLLDNCNNAVYPTTFHDLTQSSFTCKVDLVLSVEVVEHIEKIYVHNIIDTFLCGKIILMTHGLPNQKGYHHVNNQPSEYWINLLKEKGYAYLDQDTQNIRSLSQKELHGPTYFSRSGLLFAKI